MSIAALLRHHGVRTPRFVTVDGRIVFDKVAMTGAGPVHSQYGPVTAVAPHRFHGGVEQPDDEPSSSDITWWDDEALLRRNVDAMTKSFPNFVYLPPEDGLPPSWAGVIDTGRGTFEVLVMTRTDQGLPSVAVDNHRFGLNAGSRWVRPPHLYASGNLCVAERSDWNPGEHTAATVTAWAAHWLAAYTEWRITRRWPVEGVGDRVA